MKKIFVSVLCLLGFYSCIQSSQIELMSSDDFKKSVDFKDVDLYTIENSNGLTLQVTNYGVRVVSLWTPDRDGKFEDIVLGYSSIDKYLYNKGERFIGASIGRYSNRIAHGRFTLDSVEYQLSTYNNGQFLHGGEKGYDRVVWSVDSIATNKIWFSYFSPNMEEGFPGNLDVKVSYELTDDNNFEIEFTATTDKKTHVNLTHHSFFNLKGAGNGTINDAILQINADYFTPINAVLIPIGEIRSVENTPFDFREPTLVGERVGVQHRQLREASGYDHNYVINRESENDLEFAASIYEPTTGRKMEVWTTEPGIQFYGGNFFDGASAGKYGKFYKYREAFALEPQHFPDSPNHPNFPSTVLDVGETYSHRTVYKMSILKK